MINSLYEPFLHWSATGSVYIYSDPHFGDEEMQYIRKDYISDNEQVKRINNIVNKNDTLIILGDIGDISYIPKLKAGHKVLIMGNHDKGASNYIGVFNEVYSGPLIISEKIILSHEPINLPFMYNIHGHDHSNWHGSDDYHFNCCAELIDYAPINLKWLIQQGVLKNIDNIHRIAIDKQIEKKEERNGDISL